MPQKLTLYQRLNALSLDIVCGALSSMSLSVWLNNTTLPIGIWIVLAITVWLFYTADHLVDSILDTQITMAIRHTLHLKYSNYLLIVSIIVACIILIGSLLLFPKSITIFGLVLSGIITLYFALVHLFRKRDKQLPKESFIAVIYTVGTWGIPFVYTSHWPTGTESILLFSFILLVQAEGLMAAWFDYRYDKQEKHPSLARLLGYKKSFLWIRILVIASIVLIIIWSQTSLNQGQVVPLFIIWIIMAIMIVLPTFLPDFFRQKEYFRTIGELTFIVPGVFYLFKSVM